MAQAFKEGREDMVGSICLEPMSTEGQDQIIPLPGRVTKRSHTEVAGLAVYPVEVIRNDHAHFPRLAYLVPLCDPL